MRPKKYPSLAWWLEDYYETPPTGVHGWYGRYDNPFADYGPVLVGDARYLCVPDIPYSYGETSCQYIFMRSFDEGLTWEPIREGQSSLTVSSPPEYEDSFGLIDVEWDAENAFAYVALYEGSLAIYRVNLNPGEDDPVIVQIASGGPSGCAGTFYRPPKLVYAKAGKLHCIAYQSSEDPSRGWRERSAITRIAVYDEEAEQWVRDSVSPVYNILIWRLPPEYFVTIDSPFGAVTAGGRVHFFSFSGDYYGDWYAPAGEVWHFSLDPESLQFSVPVSVLPSGTVLADPDPSVALCPVGVVIPVGERGAAFPVYTMPYGTNFQSDGTGYFTEFDVSLWRGDLSDQSAEGSLTRIVRAGEQNWIPWNAAYNQEYGDTQAYFFSRVLGPTCCCQLSAPPGGERIYAVLANDWEYWVGWFFEPRRRWTTLFSVEGGTAKHELDLFSTPSMYCGGPRAFRFLTPGRAGCVVNADADNVISFYFEIDFAPSAPAPKPRLHFLPRYIRPRWPHARP